jgi:hypothetical protein
MSASSVRGVSHGKERGGTVKSDISSDAHTEAVPCPDPGCKLKGIVLETELRFKNHPKGYPRSRYE